MSFRKKSKGKAKRKSGSFSDDSSSGNEGRATQNVRRDSAIRVFPNNLVNSNSFTQDNTAALPPRDGRFQSYMVRNEGQKALLVDLFENQEAESDLGPLLKDDLKALNNSEEAAINQVILKIPENNFLRGANIVESMLASLREDTGQDLAVQSDPTIVSLGEGQHGMVFTIGRGEALREDSTEDESDSTIIVLDEQDDDIQAIIPQPDLQVGQQAAILHGGQPPVREVRVQEVILNPIPNAVDPVLSAEEQAPAFVAPVNASKNLPADGVPAILDPQALRQALDFGRIGNPSKELQALFVAVERYQSRIKQYRSVTADNGFDGDRFENQVRLLNQDNGVVLQAAVAFLNKSKTEAKKLVVQTMLNELARPYSSQNNLLRSTTDLTPPNFVKTIERLDTGTASVVYMVTANKRIGNSQTTRGIAKGELSGTDEGGATIASLISSVIINSQTQESLADSLGMTNSTTIGTLDEGLQVRTDLLRVPSLLVRQVLSSRLDKALGINVLADEEFMIRPSDNSLWGVTAFADGTQVRKEIEREGQVYSQHQWFPLINENTQKGLSDLQLMDALTGQLDRHLGNLFVSYKGKITGIDNDMAFSFQANNTSSVLKNQFSTVNGVLVYNQSQIDAGTGEKILAMTEQQFLAILDGRANDPLTLSAEGTLARDAALARFRAIKNKVQQLKNSGDLVTKWDDDTYLKSLDESQLHNGNEVRPMNYSIMIFKGFQKAQNDPNRDIVI